METQYKRKMNQSYMILYGTNQSPAYQLQMLAHNRPAGLLQLEVVDTGQRQQYWYDITGKQPLEAVLSNGSLRIELLETILSGLENTWNLLARFLLQEERLLLSPAYIFLESGNAEISFCYCPAADEKEETSLTGLLEYLLSKLDHSDAQAVKLGYDVYQGVVEQKGSFREILHQARLHKNEPLTEEVSLQQTEPAQEQAADHTEMENSQEERSVPFERENERVRYSNSQMLRQADIADVRNQRREKFEIETQPEFESLPKKKEKKKHFSFFHRKKKTPVSKEKRKSGGFSKLRKEEAEEILFEPTAFYEEKEERKTVFLGMRTPNASAMLHYEGDGNMSDFLIDREEYLIGSRAEGVDGLLQDMAVSRIHARILHRPDGYYIEDLNSLNGTTLNGRLLDFKEQVKLAQGDEICFANQKFLFSC
ncbi:MAG: DUF6382 domain-containing protein [Lachnospiraceae bacterium]